MAITVMSWNVQNFGQNTDTYTALKGANSVALARFVAEVAVLYDLSILFVMEVTPEAEPHLDQVMFALNAAASGGQNDWMYDFVKGSLENLTPKRREDLSWKSGAGAPRQEGYAVFWRNGHAGFDMMHALVEMSEGVSRQRGYDPVGMPRNAMSLSLFGREIELVKKAAGWLKPLENFDPNGGLAAAFVESKYPTVSKAVGPNSLERKLSRRPAYVVIRLTGAGTAEDNVIPLMVYHAPSYASLANPGTYVSGMARELYAIMTIEDSTPKGKLFHPKKFVASGDYNVRANASAAWEKVYGAYHNPFNEKVGTGDAGGANGTAIYTDVNHISTTIQLNKMKKGLFNGDPIESPRTDDYSFSALDNMFIRGIAPIGGMFQVGDMLADLMTNKLAGGIKAYAPLVDELNRVNRRRADPKTGPLKPDGEPLFGNSFTNWSDFRKDVRAGKFQTARSAAEFYRLFVTDHLPLVVRF